MDEEQGDCYGIFFELIRDDDGQWNGEMIVHPSVPSEKNQEAPDKHAAILNRMRLMCASVNAMASDPVVYAALQYQATKEFANSFNVDHFEPPDDDGDEEEADEQQYEEGQVLTKWTKTEGEA